MNMRFLVAFVVTIFTAFSAALGGNLVFQKNDGSAAITLDSDGNVIFSGTLKKNSTGTPGSGELVIQNSSGQNILWTEQKGTVHNTNIKGELTSNYVTNQPQGLVFERPSQAVAELHENGDLKIKGAKSSKPIAQHYRRNATGVVVAEYNEYGEKQYANLYANGLVGREDADGKQHFYLKDHLGSTRVSVSENSAGSALVVEDAYDYYPYGKQIVLMSLANVMAKEAFTGKELDRDGTLNDAPGINEYYFGARYYDPEVVAWLSMDKAGQFYSPYVYASNPLLFTDPDGDFFDPFTLAIIIGAVYGAYSGYQVGEAQGMHGLDLFAYTLGGAAIGSLAGATGAGVGSLAGGGIIGGALGGAAGGATQGFGFGALSGGNVLESTWKGAVAGLAGGAVGGAFTNPLYGAIGGGFAGGATGTALYGGDFQESMLGGLKGAALSTLSYGIQRANAYSNKTGYSEFDDPANRDEMTRAARKSFRLAGDLNQEEGGWMTKNGVERWPSGERSGITPTDRPSDATGTFHTHPNTGSRWVQSPSGADMRVTNSYAKVNAFVIGRQGTYVYTPGSYTSTYIGPTYNYLPTYTYSLIYFGF